MESMVHLTHMGQRYMLTEADTLSLNPAGSGATDLSLAIRLRFMSGPGFPGAILFMSVDNLLGAFPYRTMAFLPGMSALWGPIYRTGLSFAFVN